MKTMRDMWNNLFDSSLEGYKNEDEAIQNLSMLLHILKLEYKKVATYVSELRRKNEELEHNNKFKCISHRSPLSTLSINKNETTPVKNKFADLNISSSFDFDNDILNHQITDFDVNISKDSDNSIFIDASLDNIEPSTSPTLTKSKRERLNRSRSKKLKRGNLFTATPKSNKSKMKFKQTTLSQSTFINSSNLKNCTVTAEILGKKSINDSDETLFLPAEQINIKNKVPIKNEIKSLPTDSEVHNLLVDMKENAGTTSKKIKLNDSFDCIPEKEHDSVDFIYKREAVRKKSERMKMQGWDCPDCIEYYNFYKKRLPPEDLKKLMNQCSRHRDKFNPNNLTPKGFWNPDFSPTQQ